MTIVDQIEAMLESGLTLEQTLAAARAIEKGEKPKRSKSAKAAPSDNAQALTVLSEVLSAERAEAVIAHRAKLKKPLTPHAAALLAKAFSQVRHPDDAADMMILRGWLGFNPAWLNNGRGSAPQARQATFADLAHRFNDELEADRYEPGR